MTTTEEIMALAYKFAGLYRIYGPEDQPVTDAVAEMHRTISDLVEQAKWSHHTPDLLTEADAAADLAGTLRPGAEAVLYIHPDTFAMASVHVGAWKPGHELDGYIPLYTTPQPAQQEPGEARAQPQRKPYAYEFLPNKELLYPGELEREPDAEYLPLYTSQTFTRPPNSCVMSK